jgi:hypothetical protein
MTMMGSDPSYRMRPPEDKDLTRSEHFRKRVLAKLGGKCVRCGFDDWRALQVDHVVDHGNGLTSYEVYLDVLENGTCDGEYQCLCANCNWIKRYENKEAFGNKRSFKKVAS